MTTCRPVSYTHLDVYKRQLLEHPGPVMLSGYDNDLYNDMLTGWEKLRHPARSEKGGKRTETLWVNFQAQVGIWELQAAQEGGRDAQRGGGGAG